MKLRNATESDLPAILEIINYNILHSTAIYDYEPRTLEAQLGWFKEKQSSNMPVIVAENEGMVTGFGAYGIFRPKEAYKYCVEHSIYVNEKYQGNGVGKLLMTKLIELAREQGLHTMIAGIDAENEESIEFHKKFGFKETGRFPEVGFKFGRWLELVFMQLML